MIQVYWAGKRYLKSTGSLLADSNEIPLDINTEKAIHVHTLSPERRTNSIKVL